MQKGQAARLSEQKLGGRRLRGRKGVGRKEGSARTCPEGPWSSVSGISLRAKRRRKSEASSSESPVAVLPAAA